MSLGLTRRLVKGSEIDAEENDANFDKLEAAILAAPHVFDADGNNDAARPTGYAVVHWTGVTAQPTNALPGDKWFEAD